MVVDNDDDDDDDTNDDDDTYPIFRELLKVESHRGTTLLQVTAGASKHPASDKRKVKTCLPSF